MPERGIFFITGKSGSGKSTLLNVLSGLDVFDSGSVKVSGKDLKELTKSQLESYRNSCCGFVFQDYNLIPELSARGNVELSLQLQGKKRDEENVKAVLAHVGLSGYEDRKVNELSGGQKQRVAIARAIIKTPQIIFADEPTGALDEKTGRDILELLKKLSENSLVIVVTHDEDYAAEYGDGTIEIADGEIISNSVKAKEVKEVQAKESAEWQKSKMPIGCALKIGCSNFKYHPVRLTLTIILAVVAFALMGISLNSLFNPSPSNGYDSTVDVLKNTATVLSVIFAFFSILMLCNFLVISMEDKASTIGVLKALGCSSLELIKIFIWEGVIVGSITYALSAFGLLSGCLVMNKVLYPSFGKATAILFGLNFPVFAVMFFCIAVFSLVGCLLPILKLSHTTPIKSINRI